MHERSGMALTSFVCTRLDCCSQEVSTWYDGFWKGGKRNTKGVQTYENGAKYEGAFCDDKREGLGRCGAGPAWRSACFVCG